MNRERQRLIFAFLQWICPDHLYEEIEGDLIQKFNRDVKSFGEEKFIEDQNRSKNSLGVMIGIFSNGWSTNKSGSLVMMQSTLAERASSRYISSSGSRQAFTCFVISILVLAISYSSRNACLTSLETYLSNFGRISTSMASTSTGFERNNVYAGRFAFNKAWLEKEESFNRALIRTLQSKTNLIYSFLRSSSRISGVNPFFLACSLASCMISVKLFLLDTIRSRVSEIDFFSFGVIRATFSATGSLTSSVIVFILQI